MASYVYVPHSAATQTHYDNFLRDLKRCLPPSAAYMTPDALAVLADQALNVICYNNNNNNSGNHGGARYTVEEQQSRLQALLGLSAPLPRDRRDALLRYAELITDYVATQDPLEAVGGEAGAGAGDAGYRSILDEIQYGRAPEPRSGAGGPSSSSSESDDENMLLGASGTKRTGAGKRKSERPSGATGGGAATKKAEYMQYAFDPEAAARADEEEDATRGFTYPGADDGDGYDLRRGGDMAAVLQQQNREQVAAQEAPKVSFQEAACNVHLLRDALRRLFPAQTLEEISQLAQRVLDFLSDPNMQQLTLETQLSAVLGAHENETVMEWIGDVTADAARWRIVYGLRYAACEREGQRARVMSDMKEHALTNVAVHNLYQSLTGKSAADFTKAVPRQERVTVGEGTAQEALLQQQQQQAAVPLRRLDLNAVAFKDERSPHQALRARVTEVSSRASYDTHDEVTLPPSASYSGSDPLVKVAEAFPDWARKAFDGVVQLNPMQSRVYPCAFLSDENMLVSAPTGAGKTNVAMMAMLRALRNAMSRRNDSTTADLRELKMVYVAPMKALVQEVVRTFSARLEPLGLTVAELSGDSTITQRQMLDTQLLVTTPEKWDIVTRKSVDLGVASLLKLLIIDEVHLLHNDRGPILEAIVARTLLQQQSRGEGGIRLVGLSATLPNYRDVARFLHVDRTKGLFFFDSTFRPIPLEQTFCAVRPSRGLNQALAMNQIVYDKVLDAAQANEQTMVFVHSRRETEHTASYLSSRAREENRHRLFVRVASASEQELQGAAADPALRRVLQTLLPTGFAVHHAGLSKEERHTVETLFAEGHVRVLVCTSTLAWGVNLPANRVIIKGTRVFNGAKGEAELLSALDVLQMFGRAGRVGFGSPLGRATIITSSDDVHYYLCVLSQQLPIESQMMKRVVDMLNAEVTLGHVGSIAEAVQWLQHTYLYVRMLEAPELYGASRTEADPRLLHHLANIAHSAAEELREAQMATYRATEEQRVIASTRYGRIAAYCYVSAGSMRTYLSQLASSMQDVDLFRVFALSSEFEHITVRAEERAQLRELSESAPIAVREPVHSHLCKINLLLQCYISDNNLEGLPLMSEMVYIKDSAQRILRALYEMCLVKDFGDTARQFLRLYLMVLHRQWAVQTPVRQVARELLSAKDVAAVLPVLERQRLPWEELRLWSATDLGALFNDERRGAAVRRCFDCVPHYVVTATVRPLTRAMLYVDVGVTPDFVFDDAANGRSACEVVVSVELPQGRLLHHETVVIPQSYCSDGSSPAEEFGCPLMLVPVPDPRPTHLLIRATSTAWLTGGTATAAVSLLNLELPAVAPALQQITPATAASAEERLVRAALEPHQLAAVADTLFPFEHFTPMQHYLLGPLLQSAPQGGSAAGHSLFVGAPPGSGKTALAELFICQFLKHRGAVQLAQQAAPQQKTSLPHLLYLTAASDVAERHYLEWHYKFQAGLHETVLRVRRSTPPESLAAAAIWVSTAQDFLFHVRRPEAAELLAGVTHIIADHVHLIRSPEGKPLEECLARLHATERPLLVNRLGGGEPRRARLLALSYPLVSTAEVCNWLKVSRKNRYNFGSSCRALQVFTKPIDIPSPAGRCEGAIVSAFRQLRHLPYSAASCVIFVPRAQQTRDVARRVLQRCRADCISEDGSVGEEGEAWLRSADDHGLRALLPAGVGYLHRGTSLRDVALMLECLEHPALHRGQLLPLVVVCSFDAAGRLPAAAFQHAMVCCAERPTAGASSDDYGGDGGLPLATQDCSAAELLCMTSRASQEATVYCRTPRCWIWSRLLNDPLPLEPYVRDPEDFCDSVNAAVACGAAACRLHVLRALQSHYFLHHVLTNLSFYGLADESQVAPYASDVAAQAIRQLRAVGCFVAPPLSSSRHEREEGEGHAGDSEDDDDDDDDRPEAPVAVTARGRALAAHAVPLLSLVTLLEALHDPPAGLAWNTVTNALRLLVFHTRELAPGAVGDAARVTGSAERDALRRLANELPDAMQVLPNTLPFAWAHVGATKVFVLLLAYAAPPPVRLPDEFRDRWEEALEVLVPAATAAAAAAAELLTGDGGAHGGPARLMMRLSQCLHRRVWSCEHELRQLPALRGDDDGLPPALPAGVTLAALQRDAFSGAASTSGESAAAAALQSLLRRQAAAVPSVSELSATGHVVRVTGGDAGQGEQQAAEEELVLVVRVHGRLRWRPEPLPSATPGDAGRSTRDDNEEETESAETDPTVAAQQHEERRQEGLWWLSCSAVPATGAPSLSAARYMAVAEVAAAAAEKAEGTTTEPTSATTHTLSGTLSIRMSDFGAEADLTALNLVVNCTSVCFRVDQQVPVALEN